jgi:hypothetical protein
MFRVFKPFVETLNYYICDLWYLVVSHHFYIPPVMN